MITDIPSVIDELESIEFITKYFGGAICDNEHKKRHHFISYFVLAFLWTYEFRQLLCLVLIDDNDERTQSYFGDFTGLYGGNRLYLNMVQLLNGAHAAIVLTQIRFTKDFSWIINLEQNWRKTRFRFKPVSREDSAFLKFKKNRRETAIVIAFVACAYTVSEIITHINFIQRNTIGSQHYPWLVIMIVWTVLCTLINFTAMAQFVFVSKAIIIRFNEIYSDLEFLIKEEVPFDEPILLKFYQRHYLVCEMVTDSNNYWKKYLFVFYSIFVPLVTIQLYELLVAPMPSFMAKIVFFVSTTGCLGQILRISFSASSVVFEAHRPYHAIHGLTIRRWSLEVKTQLLIFLQRLSGPFIGFTFWDLFVVTNTLISSVFTGIFSYFIIITDMNK